MRPIDKLRQIIREEIMKTKNSINIRMIAEAFDGIPARFPAPAEPEDEDNEKISKDEYAFCKNMIKNTTLGIGRLYYGYISISRQIEPFRFIRICKRNNVYFAYSSRDDRLIAKTSNLEDVCKRTIKFLSGVKYKIGFPEHDKTRNAEI